MCDCATLSYPETGARRCRDSAVWCSAIVAAWSALSRHRRAPAPGCDRVVLIAHRLRGCHCGARSPAPYRLRGVPAWHCSRIGYRVARAGSPERGSVSATPKPMQKVMSSIGRSVARSGHRAGAAVGVVGRFPPDPSSDEGGGQGGGCISTRSCCATPRPDKYGWRLASFMSGRRCAKRQCQNW